MANWPRGPNGRAKFMFSINQSINLFADNSWQLFKTIHLAWIVNWTANKQQSKWCSCSTMVDRRVINHNYMRPATTRRPSWLWLTCSTNFVDKRSTCRGEIFKVQSRVLDRKFRREVGLPLLWTYANFQLKETHMPKNQLDPFICFDRTLTCDRRTDRHTQDHG